MHRWSPRKTQRFALALTAIFLVGGCSDSGSTGPAADGDAPLQPATLSPADQQQLKDLEQREKDRIRLAQEASKPVYDSLKREWKKTLDNKGKGSRNSPFLVCDPLAYAADVKIIGPAGGDMRIGPHKLSIPRGALARPTVITGEQPVSMLVSVHLSPHGLTFHVPPKLTLSYKHCMRPVRYLERVVYVDENNTILEYPVSLDHTLSGLVDAFLWHFSRYVIAY